MDTDRPHRSNSSCSSAPNTTTSELFICFTSRLSSSSSSMKIPSKSILSPGRSRDSSQISLSTSLSRRLRTSGSIRGGQASPMFPSTGKKRGSFENPEPSSPKVTCIGQVRVKTKKQGKKLRSRSQRRGGEVSFRRVERSKSCKLDEDFSRSRSENPNLLNQPAPECNLPPRNQRWVHLPVTVCEALRTFGAEFNCFLPCRSSCTAKDKVDKAAGSGGGGSGSSCGAVFARWLVAVQEGESKGREIELVVGGEEGHREEEEEEEIAETRSYRRHVFEEIDFKDGIGGVEEEGRVSICVPPKNALLLMRCRSDPVKMAALANKFWEPPLPNDEEDEEEKEEIIEEGKAEQRISNFREETQTGQVEEEMEMESVKTDEEHQIEEAQLVNKAEELGSVKQTEIPLQNEDPEIIKNEEIEENGVPQIEEESNLHLPLESVEPISEENAVTEQVSEYQKSESEESEDQFTVEESKEPEEAAENNSSQVDEEEEEKMPTRERPEPEGNLEEAEGIKSREREDPPLLPDCLLLMMCEPKLSMEVSKETWVCSTDFIRWLPEPSRPPAKKKTTGAGDDLKKRNSIDIQPPPPLQPPRSSCSYPAKPPARAAGSESISTAVEKKLAGSKACEPFILKRCKSEPMRTAAKLAPENCFWKKLEPHRPATVGLGAAGVGC